MYRLPDTIYGAVSIMMPPLFSADMQASMLSIVHRSMEIPSVYAVSQLFAYPTRRRFCALIQANIPKDPTRSILEIGCGLGSARELFGNKYTGIDINSAYIAQAKQKFTGEFLVVDAAQIPFAANAFDDAITIATTHHLNDKELASMIARAVTVASKLHVLDAILPMSKLAFLKAAYFRMDRGRHPRTIDQLREIVGQNARLEYSQTMKGPLHDVCYIRASGSTGIPPAQP